MSLFHAILEKLGLSKPAEQSAGTTAVSLHPGVAEGKSGGSATSVSAGAISVVDVKAKLEALAASHPQKLNWRVSIVDLLKLLGLDNSFQARKTLAAELGCPAEKMEDSAQMNMWLHKTVLQKIAENGGNIPEELL